jgi:hypothetical protein
MNIARKIYLAEYRAAHREEAREATAKWKLENPDKLEKQKIRYRLMHGKIAGSRYNTKYPEKRAASTALRKARQLQATPAWASEFFIGEIYDLAKLRTKATGFEWHVDHTVPLKNDRVCGLHCEANLRVIPATRNIKKNNRYWPDM